MSHSSLARFAMLAQQNSIHKDECEDSIKQVATPYRPRNSFVTLHSKPKIIQANFKDGDFPSLSTIRKQSGVSLKLKLATKVTKTTMAQHCAVVRSPSVPVQSKLAKSTLPASASASAPAKNALFRINHIKTGQQQTSPMVAPNHNADSQNYYSQEEWGDEDEEMNNTLAPCEYDEWLNERDEDDAWEMYVNSCEYDDDRY